MNKDAAPALTWAKCFDLRIRGSSTTQSRISGAGLIQTVVKVTFAALRPSVRAACLLMIWFGFALYSVPAILSPNTGIHILSVRIVNMLNFTFPPKTEEAVGLSFFVVLFVGTAWYFQLRILRRGTFAQISGRGLRATSGATGPVAVARAGTDARLRGRRGSAAHVGAAARRGAGATGRRGCGQRCGAWTVSGRCSTSTS